MVDKDTTLKATERTLEQGKALVRAIEALEIIEPSGPIETAITWLLLKAHRSRLRAIVAAAPAWVSEEIVSACQSIADDRPAVWLSEN